MIPDQVVDRTRGRESTFFGHGIVAHVGLVYRVGGMESRNAPGAPADNHSVVGCARFDTARRAWEPLPDLPEGRSSTNALESGLRVCSSARISGSSMGAGDS